jgi:hypothetical protein
MRRRVSAMILRALHDVGVQRLAAQIEEAIAQADFLGIFLLARHRQRQFLGGGSARRPRREDLDLAGGQVGVHRPPSLRAFTLPSMVTTLQPQASSTLKRRAVTVGDDLGHAIMIAQVDEHDAAMVALAVDPARKADGLADITGRAARRRCGCDMRASKLFPFGLRLLQGKNARLTGYGRVLYQAEPKQARRQPIQNDDICKIHPLITDSEASPPL